MGTGTRTTSLWMRVRIAVLVLAVLHGIVLTATESPGTDWLGNYWLLAAGVWFLAAFMLFSLVIWLFAVLNVGDRQPWPRPSMRSSIFKSPVEFFVFASWCGLAAAAGFVVSSLVAHGRVDTVVLAAMGCSAGGLAASWTMWKWRQ
jgi:hypothetical protein